MAATKGLTDHLKIAACEWFLMFWIFIDAGLVYSLTKFAKYCQLQLPCLICSRVFTKGDDLVSCLHLFCNKHQSDFSYLIRCNIHNELVDARETCEYCYNSFVVDRVLFDKTCSCCGGKEKSKPSGQLAMPDHEIGPKMWKGTSKPPLPRVARPARPKKTKNKMKNNNNKDVFPIGYPEVKLNSDSEFEFLFSDDDENESFKMAGIGERSSNHDLNRNKILGSHSYSTPDLRSGFLNENPRTKSRTRTRTKTGTGTGTGTGTRIRTRSTSLMPNYMFNQNYAELNKKTSQESNPLLEMKSSPLWFDIFNKANGRRSLDGTNIQNRSNISSRNSFDASDLRSAIVFDMQNVPSFPRRSASVTPNNSSNVKRLPRRSASVTPNNYNSSNDKRLPRRSASVTPNNPSSYGFRESQKPEKHAPQRAEQSTNSVSSSSNYNYGYLDDSLISRNTSNYHNRSNVPRRHSYSVLQLGGDILLNMPNDESLKVEKDYKQVQPDSMINEMFGSSFDFGNEFSNVNMDRGKGYASFDDSFVSRNTGNRHQNIVPRRHSHSFFELGCEILLNMPTNEVIIPNRSINYGFEEPVIVDQQIKKNNKSYESLNRANGYGYGSLDDCFGPQDTGNQANNNARRHSNSAYDLGYALMLNMPQLEESVTNRSSNSTEFDFINMMQFPSQNGVQSFDDSGLLLNTQKHIHKYNYNHTDDYHHNRMARRHSCSVLHLGGNIILNMPMDDETLKIHNSGYPQKSKHQKVENDKNSLPPTGSIKSDLPIDKSNWHGSFDDYILSRNQSQSQSQGQNPRRHSHAGFDSDQTLLVEIQLDNSSNNVHTSFGPNVSIGHGSGEHNRVHHKVKRDRRALPPAGPTHGHGPGSSSDVRNDLSSTSSNKRPGVRSFDDSAVNRKTGSHNHDNYHNHVHNSRRHSYSAFELGYALMLDTPEIQTNPRFSHHQVNESQHGNDFVLSHNNDTRKRYNNITRNYYSASDLSSPVFHHMDTDEDLARRSPNCIVQGLEEFNMLKFETGPSSSLPKRKRSDCPKAKKTKSIQENTDQHEPFNDFVVSNNIDNQNRYNVFSRNSQSTSDLQSIFLIEMSHGDNASRTRSKSVTPNFHSRPYNPETPDKQRSQQNSPHEHEKYKKTSSSMTSPTSLKNDLCPSCLDKIDLRSLDGYSCMSELEYGEGLEKMRQAEDDVRCMRLLQSELEAERNAATVAANHAMNMITRLQAEKASLQMEALQYLRMMEEQAEYDMEALQKSNDLVEEKENEIQDLLDELEQYRLRYGDDPMDYNFNNNTITILQDEKNYILESLSTLENKIHQLSSHQTDHLNDEYSTPKDSSGSHGAFDNIQEHEKHVELFKMEREIFELKEKVEALQVDVDLLKHACNTIRGNEGAEFIQEIALRLQDLRGIMVDKNRHL